MTKQKLTLGLILLLAISISSFAQHDKNEQKMRLDNKIDSMRVAYNFPAVAYGVIKNDSIIALNVLGFRDINTKEKVQQTDYFHIGSNTKSFTAFLAGSLIEKGLIDWDTEFFTLFPELKATSDSSYFGMTLEQLLSHRARLINFRDEPEISTIIANYENSLGEGLSIKEKRSFLMKYILQKAPLPVYSQCDDCYSNAGFIAAGLMLEKVSGLTWEELIIELSNEVKFDLHIGWPVDYNPEQPKGHINPKYWSLDIEKDLVPISDQLRKFHSFNQFGLLTAPSGNISIQTESFLKYLNLHLKGLKGTDNNLKSETYKHILTTFSSYSNGWGVEKLDGEIVYSHRGSNGTFNSFAGLFPERDMGIVVMINTYNGSGLTDIIMEISETFK